MKGGGATDDDIARHLGLSVPTLKKYYFRELDHGVSLARNQLLKVLYEKAKGGNVTAIRAYLNESKNGAAVHVMRERSAPAKGKKEERQDAAREVGGMYAPGASPRAVSH